uniref:Uncharacterized protein n=1 Tax=Romanomermis culicivorax TaxID=13658 RepID=A0A915HXP9_ROMCU
MTNIFTALKIVFILDKTAFFGVVQAFQEKPTIGNNIVSSNLIIWADNVVHFDNFRNNYPGTEGDAQQTAQIFSILIITETKRWGFDNIHVLIKMARRKTLQSMIWDLKKAFYKKQTISILRLVGTRHARQEFPSGGILDFLPMGE